MGHGWSLDFSPTHFDMFSPPDFYTKVSWKILDILEQRSVNCAYVSDCRATTVLFHYQ
jgi:hypothetical protein